MRRNRVFLIRNKYTKLPVGCSAYCEGFESYNEMISCIETAAARAQDCEFFDIEMPDTPFGYSFIGGMWVVDFDMAEMMSECFELYADFDWEPLPEITWDELTSKAPF